MPNSFSTFLIPILFVALFYFFLIRPQQKQRKEHLNMINALKKGDQVVTIGGLHGSVVDVQDETVALKVNDGTRLTFDRLSIRSLVTEDEKKD